MNSITTYVGRHSTRFSILVLLVLTTLALTPASHAATSVVAGYAMVLGDEAPIGTGEQVRLPSRSVFTTAGRGATVVNHQPGVYFVRFPGLEATIPFGTAPGVVHVRSLSNGATCVTTGALASPNDFLEITVLCYNAGASLVQSGFTVSYTRGGTEQGGLVTAQLKRDGSGNLTPAFQQSSVGGSISATQTGSGAYTVSLPLLPGGGPSTVEATQHEGQATVCSIAGTAVVGSTKQVKITCASLRGGQSSSAGFDITYAKGVNVLGKTELSDAYFSAPKLTTNTTVAVAAGDVRNVIYGQTGTVTVKRLGTGTYEVRWQNQQQGITRGVAQVTAEGSTAGCATVNTFFTPLTDFETVQVQCMSATGALADTAFQMVYLVRE